MHIYFHATPAKYLERIMREGLRSTGVSSGSTASRRYTKGKIYLWSDFYDAIDFAEEVVEERGGDSHWTILQVSLGEDWPIFEDPEIAADMTAVCTRKSIPPGNLEPVKSWDVKKELQVKHRKFLDIYPDYKEPVKAPIWAVGSWGGKWTPIWSLDIDYQLRTYEDIARKYPKDKEAVETRDLLRRLKEGEVSEEEKEELVREYPSPRD